MKVLVSIFHMGTVATDLADAVHLLRTDGRYNVTIRYATDVPYESNRARQSKEFLEGDYDYWLTIDEDNTPSENPLDLIEHDKDVIGLPTPQLAKNGELCWMVGREVSEHQYSMYTLGNKREGLVEVDVLGSGCLLIARRVIEKLGTTWHRGYDEHGIAVVGTDMAWCKRARDEGFTLWAAWDYPCHHYKKIDLLYLWRLLTGT